MDTKELGTLDSLHFSPVDVNGGLFGPPFPKVHDQPLCLAHIEGEVVVIRPGSPKVWFQGSGPLGGEGEGERENYRVHETGEILQI